MTTDAFESTALEALDRLDPDSRHPLHTQEMPWTETNCYVDLWVELLHALGLDPVAGAAFALAADFEGDQWTFVKYPPEDLRALYGIDVAEMNVWLPTVDHVVEQATWGRLLTVEVDSFYLPDTAGVSYGIAHGKTTIVPHRVDRDARRLTYFHNAGHFALEGDDFDGVFRLGEAHRVAAQLPPYVEVVRLDRMVRREDLLEVAVGLARTHVARRPADNPVPRLGARIEADLPWLREQDSEVFHLYAFGTCRQCGSSAQLAEAFVRWLADRGEPVGEAADHLHEIAEQAKALQFSLARLARGRSGSIAPIIAGMAEHWDRAMTVLDARYGA